MSLFPLLDVTSTITRALVGLMFRVQSPFPDQTPTLSHLTFTHNAPLGIATMTGTQKNLVAVPNLVMDGTLQYTVQAVCPLRFLANKPLLKLTFLTSI
jgi:hypothetical protein